MDSKFQFSTSSEEDVLHILSHLNTSKSTGPDGISAGLLKLTAPSVTASLTVLFNYSLATGSVPGEWKTANITPVPKGGDKQQANNYRPISVLPIISKVFEKLVHK